jgi:hypothetical protein
LSNSGGFANEFSDAWRARALPAGTEERFVVPIISVY